jgi:tRNA(fMet)-specific endonuclease VapC
MNGRVLLDTNIVIALFRGDPAIEEEIANATEVFVPSIVLGELYFGAANSQNSDENIEKLHDLASESVVVPVDERTALEYGVIKNRLKEKGRPIPENDIWIAAIAQQHDLALVTRDDHFNEVENLETIAW